MDLVIKLRIIIILSIIVNIILAVCAAYIYKKLDKLLISITVSNNPKPCPYDAECFDPLQRCNDCRIPDERDH